MTQVLFENTIFHFCWIFFQSYILQISSFFTFFSILPHCGPPQQGYLRHCKDGKQYLFAWEYLNTKTCLRTFENHRQWRIFSHRDYHSFYTVICVKYIFKVKLLLWKLSFYIEEVQIKSLFSIFISIINYSLFDIKLT